MSRTTIVLEGRSWITIEAISECYECDVSWVREACDYGLFGTVRAYAGTLVLRVTVLDQVARVVRLNRYEGLGFETIVALLGDFDPDEETSAR
jgi:hypothetical protein